MSDEWPLSRGSRSAEHADGLLWGLRALVRDAEGCGLARERAIPASLVLKQADPARHEAHQAAFQALGACREPARPGRPAADAA